MTEHYKYLIPCCFLTLSGLAMVFLMASFGG